MKWNEKFKSEKWNISCHINTQGCHNHQQFQPSSVKCWVLRAFRKKNTCYLRASQSLSCAQLFVNPWTVACQTPLSMGFCRQEYWSGLPFPSPGGLPNPWTKHMFLKPPELGGRFFTTSTTCTVYGKYTLGRSNWIFLSLPFPTTAPLPTALSSPPSLSKS